MTRVSPAHAQAFSGCVEIPDRESRPIGTSLVAASAVYEWRRGPSGFCTGAHEAKQINGEKSSFLEAVRAADSNSVFPVAFFSSL
jgi:hypothetical protein